ncbi:MAG: hypothetical protein ACKOAG_02760, partial [Candidatus Kapaibacterium sp.]
MREVVGDGCVSGLPTVAHVRRFVLSEEGTREESVTVTIPTRREIVDTASVDTVSIGLVSIGSE